jgi:hypothetical protein
MKYFHPMVARAILKILEMKKTIVHLLTAGYLESAVSLIRAGYESQ